jgi:hypothetical protein
MTTPRFRQMLTAGAAILSLTTTALVPAPAYALVGGIVHDPQNYVQNIMTAARTLEQINNQIRMIQNQSSSLLVDRPPQIALRPDARFDTAGPADCVRHSAYRADVRQKLQGNGSHAKSARDGGVRTGSVGIQHRRLPRRPEGPSWSHRQHRWSPRFRRAIGHGQSIGDRRAASRAGREPAPRVTIAATCRLDRDDGRARSRAGARRG